MPEPNPEIIESMNLSIFEGSYPIDKKILLLNFDDLVESDIVKIIPVLRAINALYKGVLGVRDRFFMRKVVLFINQYNSGFDTSETQKFASEVLTDEKFRERVIEKILILLDRFDDEFKALILAELTKNLVKRNIDWDTFQRLTYTVERAHPSVFPVVYDYYKNYEKRSKSSGEILNPLNSLIIGSGLGFFPHIEELRMSKDALNICKYGMENLFDNQYENFPENIKQHLKKVAERKKEKFLDNPNFSDYERWVVRRSSGPNSNYKIRKVILDKICKYYPI